MNPAPLQPPADTDQRQRGARRREQETSKELERELDWLAALLQVSLEHLFSGDTTEDPAEDTTGDPANPSPFSPQLPPIPEPPPLLVANASSAASPLAQLAAELADEPLARLALALLLAAQLRPQALDALQVRNPQLERRFSECGGVVRESGFEPTGDTLALLADGGQVADRLAVLRLLAEEGPLRRLGLLAPPEGDAPLKGGLRLSGAWLEWIAGAGPRPGDELAAATARRLTTEMAWQDLVLPAGTLRQSAAGDSARTGEGGEGDGRGRLREGEVDGRSGGSAARLQQLANDTNRSA